ATVANLPRLAANHDRRGAIVEAVALEVAERLLGGEGSPLEPLVLVKGDLSGALRGRGCGAIGIAARVAVDGAYRRNAVVQAHRTQCRVPARTQVDAFAAETGTVAN